MRVPPERRAATVRRIVAFFRPYRLQVARRPRRDRRDQPPRAHQPVPAQAAHRQRHRRRAVRGAEPLRRADDRPADRLRADRRRAELPQQRHRPERDAGPAQRALRAPAAMPLRFFTATRTGEIQSRLANDVGGVQAVVTDTASSITSNVAVAISTIIAMFLLSWQLTLLSLGIPPFFLYLTYRVGKVRREVSSETQKPLADMSAVTEETLSVSGILLGKTFGGAGAVHRAVPRPQPRARAAPDPPGDGRPLVLHDHRHDLLDHAGVRVLARGHDGGERQSPDAPTAGDIVAFTTLQSRLFFPMGQLLNVQVEIQGSLALFDRIFEYLDLDPEITDAPDAIALEPAEVARGGRLRGRVVPRTRRSRAPPGRRPPTRPGGRPRGERRPGRSPVEPRRRRRSRCAGPTRARRAEHPPGAAAPRSASRTSRSRRSRASSSRSSGRRAPARRRRPT